MFLFGLINLVSLLTFPLLLLFPLQQQQPPLSPLQQLLCIISKLNIKNIQKSNLMYLNFIKTIICLSALTVNKK